MLVKIYLNSNFSLKISVWLKSLGISALIALARGKIPTE
jgi:hypothetical protein